MHTAKISGTGHYVPERIVTNEYLSTLMETNDEWITERTGIRERRWVEEGDGNTAATMGIKAARSAIKAEMPFAAACCWLAYAHFNLEPMPLRLSFMAAKNPNRADTLNGL